MGQGKRTVLCRVEGRKAKLKLVEKDKVAGIAFWKLGLERKEAWESVTDWLK